MDVTYLIERIPAAAAGSVVDACFYTLLLNMTIIRPTTVQPLPFPFPTDSTPDWLLFLYSN